MSDTIFNAKTSAKSSASTAAFEPKTPAGTDLMPNGRHLRKSPIGFPEPTELDLVRHYSALARKIYNVDENFYPLGSCTMKYNPKISERAANTEELMSAHPLMDETLVQGWLEILYKMEKLLCGITGMQRFCLQPAAGAHGELTGILMIKAYHAQHGQARSKIIVPDTSHGTNPATAAFAGYQVVTVQSNEQGCIDLCAMDKAIDKDTAAVMITIPNTLGLFEKEILSITSLAHSRGALCYCDGANLNAIMGITKPSLMDFDVMHVNLHKTFAAPHGGGGPGSGPLGASERLTPYLPAPLIDCDSGHYKTSIPDPRSIGRVKAWWGNAGVILKSYAYILMNGADGLKEASQAAVTSANWLKEKLKKTYELPYDRHCMHEFVLSAKRQAAQGVHALDIAKALLDYGFHAPTIYFPLIVSEALMIEPTETENLSTLKEFADVMNEIAQTAETNPEKIKQAPVKTPVRRVDEVSAARTPCITCQ